MTIQRIEEFQITPSQHQAIHRLLTDCFDGYPSGRTYFKQVPSFRFLAHQGTQLIAHLAVEHRMIAVAEQPAAIFGVVDICVHPDFRQQQIASSLLEQLEQLGQQHEINFIVLTATDHQLYTNLNYTVYSHPCRWLLINDHKTLGVHHRRLDNTLLVKALGERTWPEGVVDFLGAVF